MQPIPVSKRILSLASFKWRQLSVTMSWPETAARSLLKLPPSAGNFADFAVFSNPGQIRSNQIELLNGFRQQFAPDGFRRTIHMLESC